jgi:hypothetical protein
LKCIHCDRDVRYKDRRDGRCDGCRKPFAFEPQRRDLFTDRAFQNALETLTGRGRLRFGIEHLYWELARRRTRKQRGLFVGCSVVSLGVALMLGFLATSANRDLGFFAMGALGLSLWMFLLVRSPGRASRDLSLEQFNKAWTRWNEVHGRPGEAIQREPRRQKPREAAEPDLYDYSFDRVVICDRARTVDLLVANNFHFENNCAVLSIAGYPEAVFAPVRAMLKRNPRLEVFALHDATPFGCRVAERLATDPEWFKGHRRVVDVGLRPRHVLSHREYWLASEVAQVTPGGGLSAEEAKWLSRYRVELAVYRPEAILRALFRAINRQEELVMTSPHARAQDSGNDDSFDSFG